MTGEREYDAAAYLLDEADCVRYLRACLDDDPADADFINQSRVVVGRAMARIRLASGTERAAFDGWLDSPVGAGDDPAPWLSPLAVEAAWQAWKHLSTEIAQLKAYADALNAERYRWMRAQKPMALLTTAWGASSDACAIGADADAAIDAAMKAQP